MDRIEAVNRVFEGSEGPGVYLEIGVQRGEAFRRVRARVRIGVDPGFQGLGLWVKGRLGPLRSRLRRRSGDFLFSCTSDEFFRRQHRILGRAQLDCVLVDGLHSAEQAHRDIVNSLEFLGPSGVVVVHDCNPGSEWAAMPTMEMAFRHPEFDGQWNGDVWKAMARLRATREDLRICVLDCDQGLGLIRKGVPEARLDLSESEVEALAYAELDADRERMLNLRPADHLEQFLA